jgi:hypothetical protein
MLDWVKRGTFVQDSFEESTPRAALRLALMKIQIVLLSLFVSIRLVGQTATEALPMPAAQQDAKGFVVPVVKSGEWLILQFKSEPKAKAVTARFEYNTAICEGCQAQEWICKCEPEAEKK